MPVAQRSKVGLAVVVAADDVVYVGRQLGTSDAIVAPGAAVAVPAEDAAADSGPVVGELRAPVRSSPLGHLHTHPYTVGDEAVRLAATT